MSKDTLVLHLAEQDQDQIRLADIPPEMRDVDQLTVLDGDGMIEFGSRRHHYQGSNETPHVDPGWEFGSVTQPGGRSRMARVITGCQTDDRPVELQTHIRLTDRGQVEAARLRDRNVEQQTGGREVDQGQQAVTIPRDLQRHLDQLPPDSTPSLRPAYRRDWTWLHWRDAEGLGPAAIRERWNELDAAVRRVISPRCFAGLPGDKDSARRRVSAGIRRAREEQTQAKKRSRKTTSRKK